jgi:hypothetical protein
MGASTQEWSTQLRPLEHWLSLSHDAVLTWGPHAAARSATTAVRSAAPARRAPAFEWMRFGMVRRSYPGDSPAQRRAASATWSPPEVDILVGLR